MALTKCPSCDANADLTANGQWAHCASCNNIFQPEQSGSGGAGDGKGKEEGEKSREESKEGEGKK